MLFALPPQRLKPDKRGWDDIYSKEVMERVVPTRRWGQKNKETQQGPFFSREKFSQDFRRTGGFRPVYGINTQSVCLRLSRPLKFSRENIIPVSWKHKGGENAVVVRATRRELPSPPSTCQSNL